MTIDHRDAPFVVGAVYTLGFMMLAIFYFSLGMGLVALASAGVWLACLRIRSVRRRREVWASLIS